MGSSRRLSRRSKKNVSKKYKGRKYKSIKKNRRLNRRPTKKGGHLSAADELSSYGSSPDGRVNTPSSFVSAPALTSSNLNEENKQLFEARKKYETKIWDLTRDHMLHSLGRTKSENQFNRVGIVEKTQEFLIILVSAINKNSKKQAFWDSFKLKYQEKYRGFYLTGVIDYEEFADQVSGGGDIGGIIRTHCPNIRTCLTTIDYIVKALEGFKACKSSAVMKYYIESFDNCIRYRDSYKKFGDDSNFSKYKFCIKDYQQICAGSGQCSINDPTCANLNSEEGLIEPYTPAEADEIQRVYRKAGVTKPFDSGLNIFYLDKKPMDTYGVFAAGISGHTHEIGLMFNLFTNTMNGDGKHQKMQQFIATICLTWMLDYFHHSLREILLASCVHFKPWQYMWYEIEYLYRQGTNRTTIETISKNIEAIILFLSKNMSDASTASDASIVGPTAGCITQPRNCLSGAGTPIPINDIEFDSVFADNMIDYMFRDLADPMGPAPDINAKLIQTAQNINNFEKVVKDNSEALFNEVYWPEQSGVCKYQQTTVAAGKTTIRSARQAFEAATQLPTDALEYQYVSQDSRGV